MSESPAHANRIIELYHEGGIREVCRGISDWLVTSEYFPLRLIYPETTLSIQGATATFVTQSSEDFLRATRHDETAVLKEFVDEVSSDDIVWDVGANIGMWSILGADAGATIISFEPGAKARASLERNANASGIRKNIDSTPYALADWSGSGTLCYSESTAERKLVGDADAVGDTVPVSRGDDLDIQKPDVVKIDVEGAEYAVLDGMEETLLNVRTCFVEVHKNVQENIVGERLRSAGLTDIDQHTIREGETVWVARRENEE